MKITNEDAQRSDGFLPSAGHKPVRKIWIYLGWLIVVCLLWWSLRGIPLEGILQTLRLLRAWQIGVLLGLNILIILLITSRWWLILRSAGHSVPYLNLAAYRLASFAVSYFTPGPQIGGEAFQVLCVHRRHQVPTITAISSVFLDKLLEILSTFTFLVFGMAFIALSDLRGIAVKPWMWVMAPAILLLPAAHLFALRQGKTPATWLFSHLFQRWKKFPIIQKILSVIQQTEEQIERLWTRHPRTILHTISVSIVVWLGLVFEYALMLQFLGIDLSLAQTILALTLARLAFMIPLPGGLGALESSQVLAMQLLGFSPVLGITISLVIRARDIILGVAGLWLANWAMRR